MDFDLRSKTIAPTSAKRYRNPIVEAVFLLIIALLGYVFLVQPKAKNVKDLRQTLASDQGQYDSVQQDTTTMNQLLSKIKNSETELKLADQALPLESRVTLLHVLVDNLASTAGMKLAAITAVQTPGIIAAGDKNLLAHPYDATRKLQTIDLTVTVTGNMDQFKDLLKLVETNSRILDITNIEISSQEGTTIFKLKIKAYTYTPEPPSSNLSPK